MSQETPPFGASIVTGAILFTLVLLVPGVLADPDTAWQIRTGEWILSKGAIPHTDPFSYTNFGRPWVTHEWLAETLMALAHRAAGARGVMALTAVAAGITAGLLLHVLRRFMALPWAVTIMALAMANTAGSLLARPHALAWPCLVLWCGGLVLARAGRIAPSWWLLPVMTLWVNLHGSFMIGLLLPLAFLLEAAIEAGRDWRVAARGWAAFIAAAWLAALVNPDTIQALIFPFKLLSMRNLDWIGEWQPADFSAFHPLELTLLALLGAGLSGRVAISPSRLLMLVGLVHVALRHWRHDQLLGLLGALLLAETIGRLVTIPENSTSRTRVPIPAIAGGLLAAIALTIRLSLPLSAEPGEGVRALLDQVPSALRARPVLNDYGFGAYLIAHDDRPFIDSRADMYGDEFLGRFRTIAALKPGALNTALSDFDIAWTIFPPASPLVPALDQQPGWHRLSVRGSGETPAAIVHVRDDVVR